MRIITEIELVELLEKEVYNNYEEKLKKISLLFTKIKYDILIGKLKVDIKDIVYSQYFWYQQYKKEFIKQHKWTADFEDYEYTLLENIDHYTYLDFDIIEKMENGGYSI